MKLPKFNHRQMLLALAASAAVTGLAQSRLTLEMERALLTVLYAIPTNYDVIIINITHFGSLAALYSAILVTFILGHKKLSLNLFMSGMVAYLASSFLKELIMRPRPAQLWSEFTAREWGVISYGYPSGHTALIVAVAFTLWPYVKAPYRVWLVIMAVAVGLSRMILAVHLPLDVVGGAILGILASYISHYIIQSLKIKH